MSYTVYTKIHIIFETKKIFVVYIPQVQDLWVLRFIL